MTWMGSRGWIAACGLAIGAALALTPSSASAKDEFENGFKDELGRIAAREAVHAGRHVVAAVVREDVHHHRVHVRHADGVRFYWGPPRHARVWWQDPYRHRHRHWRHQRQHARHGHADRHHRHHGDDHSSCSAPHGARRRHRR